MSVETLNSDTAKSLIAAILMDQLSGADDRPFNHLDAESLATRIWEHLQADDLQQVVLQIASELEVFDPCGCEFLKNRARHMQFASGSDHSTRPSE